MKPPLPVSENMLGLEITGDSNLGRGVFSEQRTELAA